MPGQCKWFDSKLTDLPRLSASESYAFVPTPSSKEDNPLFRPDPMLYKVRKLTKTLRRPWGQGQKLVEALCILFDKNERSQLFPSFVTETSDKKGVKWYKFQPDYVDHLTLAMQLVSRILNDYLQAAGKTRTFWFGKSSHYEMEFSDLVYRHWATHLILESFKNRLLRWNQLAKEVIESFIKESEFKPGEGPEGGLVLGYWVLSQIAFGQTIN